MKTSSRLYHFGAVFGALAMASAATVAQDALFVDATGNVGVGTSTPSVPFHITRSNGTAQVLVQELSGTSALRTQLRMVNNGPVNTQHETGGATWRQQFQNNAYTLTKDGTGGNEITIIASTGDLIVRGSVFAQTFSQTSSRTLKTDFGAVDSGEVLERLTQLDVATWRYKDDPSAATHLGPMAEDFQSAFGIGDGKTLSTVDTTGVAFAAIQGLNQRLSTEVRQLHQALEAKDAQVQALQARLQSLEELLVGSHPVGNR